MFESSRKSSQDLEINKKKVISENIWELKKHVWLKTLGILFFS